MRVLICGGRDYGKTQVELNNFYNYLDAFAKENNITFVVSGGARGADTLASGWASLKGIEQRVFPADWERYGKSAGFIRNKQMLDEGKPDIVIAFGGGKGTDMMVALADKAGVEWIRIY